MALPSFVATSLSAEEPLIIILNIEVNNIAIWQKLQENT